MGLEGFKQQGDTNQVSGFRSIAAVEVGQERAGLEV